MCACAINGGNGIAVSGDGSGQNPYEISFTGGDEGSCSAVMSCVAGNLGQGLRVAEDSGELSARLSSDGGNSLVFGSDGGLFTSGGAGGSGGGVTVDGLPESGVLCGYRGAGWLLSPENVLRSFVTAVDLRLHMADLDVAALRDGALAVTGYGGTAKISSGPPYNPGGPDAVADMTAMEWRRMLLDIGDMPDPFAAGRTPDPQVGWFAFCEAPAYGGTFLSEVLAEVGNRIVLTVEMQNPGAAADPLLAMIQRHGCQKSVIVQASSLSDLEPFVNATVAAGLLVGTQEQADSNPPQDLIDAGVGWVFISQQLSDDTISGYADAGLQVMVYRVDRHRDRQRVGSLGARGVVSGDPMYVSGEEGRYKQSESQFRRSGVHYGWLSTYTDAGELSGNTGGLIYSARGFYSSVGADVGWSLPSGTDQSGGGVTDSPYGVLQGYLCPTPASGYTITFTGKFYQQPQAGQNWFGVVFGVNDDGPFLGTLPSADGTGYIARLWGGGAMQLSRIDGSTITDLDDSDIGSPSAGQWFTFHVEVTQDQLRLWLDGDEGGAVTVGDAQWRGGYIHAGKLDRSNPVGVAFQGISVSTGG